MRRMSVSSMMSFGAGIAAASYFNSKNFSKKSMKKMKRKVRSLF
ncbi:DUF3918 family protein [Bacillus massiliigorillae]|nr:DUF3918 family protein [Bacillus massiliigorillae]